MGLLLDSYQINIPLSNTRDGLMQLLDYFPKQEFSLFGLLNIVNCVHVEHLSCQIHSLAQELNHYFHVNSMIITNY